MSHEDPKSSRARQNRHQAGSLPRAARKGREWTSAELDLVADEGNSIEDLVDVLERTYKSIVTRRWMLKQNPLVEP